MSDLILCAKASTAKQPKSERFSGTLPAHSHHRLSVFSGIPTWPHPSSFQGPKVSSEFTTGNAKPISLRMRMSWRTLSCLLASLPGALPSASPAQVREATVDQPRAEVTRSTSEQFRIYGGDRRARGSFASFAEGRKQALLRLLGLEDGWHHPIVIRIAGKLTDPAVAEPIDWRVNQFGDTFALEIGVTLCTEFSRERMTETLLHMLMFEMALRDVEVPVTDRLIPRWLRVGLPKAMRLRRDGRPSGFFKMMFELNLVPLATEILSATKTDVDSFSRAIYEASTSGFVLMLLDEPGGSAKLAKLVHGFGGAHRAVGHDFVARYFPSLRGPAEQLERTWILYCTKLAAPKILEFLDPAATEAQLAEALKVSFLEYEQEAASGKERARPMRRRPLSKGLRRFPKDLPRDEKSAGPEAGEATGKTDTSGKTEPRPTRTFKGTIADFERFIRRKDRKQILAPVRRRLIILGFRSFPLHRPLINDYSEAVADLLAGRPKGVKDRLRALKSERERLLGLMKNVEAFMDDYEKTQWDRKSGVFDAYIRRAEAVDKGRRKARDPISAYMDAVERALE